MDGYCLISFYVLKSLKSLIFLSLHQKPDELVGQNDDSIGEEDGDHSFQYSNNVSTVTAMHLFSVFLTSFNCT